MRTLRLFTSGAVPPDPRRRHQVVRGVKYGKGYGCEVCKPTVGSLLASCWNEYILKPQHTPLQDTNDNFLGNIQKDGTYSVIPRSAGGEITPDGLLAIGQIAKEYNLYTKMTGSQRIGMFGAQKDDLPAIWRKLLAAGFETGHAYAKALRMAKTCVGSTRCRYGVGDSVGFGVTLEHRYKGIRTPHKMKFGVSGCTGMRRSAGQRRRHHPPKTAGTCMFAATAA